MTIFPAGRQALCMSPVGQPFECGVNPSEAEGFNDIEVRKRVGLRRLRPVAGYPAATFRKMVSFKPLPQLSAIGEGQEVGYFHGLCNKYYAMPNSSISNINVEPPGMPGCENLP